MQGTEKVLNPIYNGNTYLQFQKITLLIEMEKKKVNEKAAI